MEVRVFSAAPSSIASIWNCAQPASIFATVMRLIAGRGGAINGLLAEVVEDHIRTHLVDRAKNPGAQDNEATDQLVGVAHTYFK